MKLRLKQSGLAIALLALAGCGPSEPASSGGSPVIRRLTEDQYRHIIADIFGGDIAVAGRFDPLNRTDGLLTLGSARAVWVAFILIFLTTGLWLSRALIGVVQ